MHVRGASHFAQDAIRNTQDCEEICVQTAQYCLEVGGSHADAMHVRMLQDCADICETAARIVLRGSQHQVDLAAACAAICEACAASCEKFIGDPQMKACANQCRLCAAACRQLMANSTSESSFRASFQSSGQHASASSVANFTGPR
ncbi:MAG: four-helix bundle copper-binding protein [Minicystis sp.]